MSISTSDQASGMSARARDMCSAMARRMGLTAGSSIAAAGGAVGAARGAAAGRRARAAGEPGSAAGAKVQRAVEVRRR